MRDWKDILLGNEEPLSEEELLKYLDKELPAEDKSAIEDLAAGSFETDALQGLQQVKDAEKVKKHINQLKLNLHKQLQNKKNKQEKRKPNVLEWIIYVIILLLFICVIGYVLVRMYNNKTTGSDFPKVKTQQVR
jgi:cytoskeletal protein RodZ